MRTADKEEQGLARGSVGAGDRAARGKSPRLAEVVVQEIGRRIAADELSPGQKLPTEAELTQSMAVSRTVIREAISRLQAAGLVETRHGVGTFVANPQPHAGLGFSSTAMVTLRDVIALMEFRVSLETEASAMAALRREEHHLAAMRAAVEAFARRLTEGGKAVQPDVDFHRQIMLATGNTYFVDVFTSLGTVTVPRTRINTAMLAEQRMEHYLIRTNMEHEDILSAIERQDPEGARAGMRTHLVNSIERLKRMDRLGVGDEDI